MYIYRYYIYIYIYVYYTGPITVSRDGDTFSLPAHSQEIHKSHLQVGQFELINTPVVVMLLVVFLALVYHCAVRNRGGVEKDSDKRKEGSKVL